MFKFNKTAFSLIELMVVIAVVGILSAIATPAYKDYVTRAKVNNAYTVVQNFAKKIAESYEINGSFPASVNFGGVAIPNTAVVTSVSATTLGTSTGITSIYYSIKDVGSNPFTDTNLASAYIQAELNPTFIGNVDTGDVLKLSVLINKSTGIISFPCGIWPGVGNDIDDEFLPASCTCNAMSSLQGGSLAPLCN